MSLVDKHVNGFLSLFLVTSSFIHVALVHDDALLRLQADAHLQADVHLKAGPTAAG